MNSGRFQQDCELDQLADEFESNWTINQPRFEDFLERVEPPLRPALLELMLEVDIELGHAANAAIDTKRYEHLGSTAVDFARQILERTSSPAESQQQSNPSAKIDGYTLIRRLGKGGMGEVWLAEQTEPVKRTVAVKLILPGWGAEELVTRFLAERNALARMNHPNIAKILDAGTTTDGQPYFIMEFVESSEKDSDQAALALTEFCDRHCLSIESRLRLFADVCAGVQHAHQKGIVHRDLKPRNIFGHHP